MGKKISVRELNEEVNIQELRRLLNASSAEYYTKGNLFPFMQMNDEVLRSKLKEGKSYAAYDEGKMAGFVNYQILSNGKTRYAYIYMIAFDREYGADGVDSTLIQEVEKESVSSGGIAYITVDIPAPAKQLVKWFVDKGFRKTSCLRRSDVKHFIYVLHKPMSADTEWNSALYCTYQFELTRIRAMMRHEGDGEHSLLHNLVSSMKYRMKAAFYAPQQKKTLEEVRRKQQAKVVFFASCLSMWKYQFLYEEMSKDKRYDTVIVLSPFVNYSLSQQQEDLRKLKDYFDRLGTPYIDYDFDGTPLDVRKELKPDILFYPQPYLKCMNKLHRFNRFQDRLLAYYPYGFFTERATWVYNNQFLNIAWKLFYATEMQRAEARRVAANGGRNAEVVGYPGADEFMQKKHTDPWKQGAKRKRIIWAPHFSIHARLTSQSNFLWMADFMLEIANEYSDRIQLAFKPHPRLKSELYKVESWGKDKTDQYYDKWATMENGQLETGEFVDLFYYSDAMVHDSASFTVDYHYTRKPVMFVSKNIDGHKMTLGEFGKKAIDMHYIGTKTEDIRWFIEQVVLEGKDSMLEERTEFYEKYLLPPNGKTTAQNTVERMNELLF